MTKHADTPFAKWLQAENGRAAALSRKSKMLRSALISKFKNGDREIGVMHAIEIERATNRLFRAEDLCARHADLILYLRGQNE
jgi:hypothetical protein